MKKAICVVPISPMRAEPSHRSEQVSQLVFGDVCEVNETNGDFVNITSVYDSYSGWCQKVQLQLVDEVNAFFPTILVDTMVGQVVVNNQPMQVPLGSNIGFIQGDGTAINKLHFTSTFKGMQVPLQPDKQNMYRIAMTYLNTAYQWGGRTVFGVDCSGFTQMVYKFGGIRLLRDASLQATQGVVVDFLQEATFGDLAFFDNDEGRITHVGIMLNSSHIIHASGKVRIDTIDPAGIMNGDTGERTHKLRIVKRMM